MISPVPYRDEFASCFRAVVRSALCIHLTIFLTGCGSTAPKLDEAQRIQLQSRTYSVSFADAFEAGVHSLKELGYEIDLVDAQAGLISGVKSADAEFAKIEGDDGIPTWAWVVGAVFIVVIAVVVVAVAIAGSDDDDEHDKEEEANTAKSDSTIVVHSKDRANWAAMSGVRDPGGNVSGAAPSLAGAQSDSTDAVDEAGVRDPGGNVRVTGPGLASSQSESGSKGTTRQLVSTSDLPEKQSRKSRVRVTDPEKIRRRQRAESEDYEAWYFADAVYFLDFVLAPEAPPDKPWYHYRLTLNFDDSSDTSTNVQVEIKGSTLEGHELEKSGPVFDQVMHRQFFATLDRYLRIANDSTRIGGK